MLSVEHVTKRYGKFTALEDVNLAFQPGVYGLLAPNGAGKTTLIKLLATLLFPTEGKILWDGENIHVLGAEYRGLLGYLPQDFGFYPSYTARQFLRYAAALQCLPKREAEQRISELLDLVGLADAADKKLKTFSGGMRQRVGIAVAMLTDPKLLLLDEPTAGLDPVGVESILGNIRDYHKAQNATIILVSHSMEEVARSVDRLVVVNDGKIPFQGAPREVFAHGDELEAMGLGVPQMTRVFHRLRQMGVDIDPSVYTIDQARQAILAKLDRGPHKAADRLCGERKKEAADMECSAFSAEHGMEQTSSDEGKGAV